jgi:hypothetical protein
VIDLRRLRAVAKPGFHLLATPAAFFAYDCLMVYLKKLHDRAARTDAEAKALQEKERKARMEKTARLREQRLAAQKDQGKKAGL